MATLPLPALGWRNVLARWRDWLWSTHGCQLLSLLVVLPVLVCGDSQAATQKKQPHNHGLVAWWQANGNTRDVVGKRTAELKFGATFGPGVRGKAFKLDGFDDFVEVKKGIGAFNFGYRDFSISVWVNFRSPSSGEQVIIEKRLIPQAQAASAGYARRALDRP